MLKYNRYIESDEVRSEHLRAHFNCSQPTVSAALHFKRNSMLARSIRVYAVNFLGCRIVDNLNLFI